MCRLPTEKKKTCRFSDSSCSLCSAPAPPGVAAALKVPIYVYGSEKKQQESACTHTHVRTHIHTCEHTRDTFDLYTENENWC